MNRQANILFIPTSISSGSTEPQGALSQNNYYQKRIYASLASRIHTSEAFESAGKQLAAIARHAYLARNIDAVEQAAQLMLSLPISEPVRNLARFYEALCILRRGDIDSSGLFLQCLSEAVPPQYRARSLQLVGLTHQKRGDVDQALPFYIAAGRAALNCDLLTLVQSRNMIAVVRGIHGDHKHALEELENLFPIAREVSKYYPPLYYDFLNSLAVELAEVGRLAEASAALSIALASPFAAAYPEWSETRDEIAAKRISASRSIVPFNRWPEAAPSPKTERQRRRKPVSFAPFIPPPNKDSFQRAIIRIPARVATPFKPDQPLRSDADLHRAPRPSPVAWNLHITLKASC